LFTSYLTKALHQWLPTFPDIPVQFLLNDYLTVAPWDQIAWTPFVLSFAAIGFFFLLPTDVLFSLWFFFLLSRLQQVAAISFNLSMPTMPTFPLPLFLAYQTMGAYCVLAGYLLWIARAHLYHVWAVALGREFGDDAQELLPYRVAVWGLLGSILASALWLWGMGMSLWLALMELIVFLFITAIIMARSTAEAGLLMTESTFRPVDFYRMIAPLHGLGPTNLTLLAFVDNLFLRDQRGLLLTGFLDTARMAEGTAFRRRSFAGILALGVAVAVVVAVGMNIALPYHFGALQMDQEMEQSHAQMLFQSYAPYFAAGATESPGVSGQMLPNFVGGILVTLALIWLRSAYFWWPLHPLGYALSGSWGTIEFWFPCLIAWTLKSLTVRYGGLRFYQQVRPFFLGLIIGEFGIEFVLVLLRIFFRLPAPTFPWF
jgi:hypothetical protein